MRDARNGIFDNEMNRNPYVWVAFGLCLALLLIAVYAPGLAGVLQLRAPPCAAGSWRLASASCLGSSARRCSSGRDDDGVRRLKVPALKNFVSVS